MPLTAWALTTGEAGMRTQARGLAHAVADTVIEKTLRRGLRWPWRGLAPAERLVAPWPDLVVSCGRRSAYAALRLQRLSSGRSLAVHVQDPRVRAGDFDLIIAMEHDAIAAGGHVMKVATALHDLTPTNLADAAAAWRDRFAILPRPLTGVAIGGHLKGRAFTIDDGRRLLVGLQRLRRETGGGLAITPSRRTPKPVLDLLAEAWTADPGVFLWDLRGENPYLAILALSDRLVVTSDSVSMISEALATPHPVEVFDLGFPRHVDFIQRLVDRSLIRRFVGDPTPPATAGPVNATLEAAAVVRALIQARTGSCG